MSSALSAFPIVSTWRAKLTSADRIVAFYVAAKMNILASRDGGANLFASSPLTGWRQGAAGAAAVGSLTCYQGAVYHC